MPSITVNWLKNMVYSWAMLKELSQGLYPHVVSLTAQTYSKNMWKGHETSQFHMHIFFLLLEASGTAVISFWQRSTLSSNTTTDVLMLMLSIILNHLFSHSSFLVTERKPSRTVQATGGLVCKYDKSKKRLPNKKQRKSKTERESWENKSKGKELNEKAD